MTNAVNSEVNAMAHPQEDVEGAASSTDQTRFPLVEGTIVDDRYELLRLLGEGASGAVWEAKHCMLTTHVALKFLNPGFRGDDRQMLLERFRYEAQISARLGVATESIVAVHDMSTFRGRQYIVMDLAHGASLESRIQAAPLSPEDVLGMLRDVGHALRVAHASGIVHRDVKPANILAVQEAGAGNTSFKLADFGVAKGFGRAITGTLQPRATSAGMMVGSPAYMSPEQIVGDVNTDGSADVWALAVVAYESLSTELPFEAPHLGQLAKCIMDGVHPPITSINPSLPPSLDDFFRRAFAKDSAARFLTVDALVDGFAAALLTPPTAATQETERLAEARATDSGRQSSPIDLIVHRRPRGRGVRRWAVPILVLVAIVTVALVGFALAPSPAPPRAPVPTPAVEPAETHISAPAAPQVVIAPSAKRPIAESPPPSETVRKRSLQRAAPSLVQSPAPETTSAQDPVAPAVPPAAQLPVAPPPSPRTKPLNPSEVY